MTDLCCRLFIGVFRVRLDYGIGLLETGSKVFDNGILLFDVLLPNCQHQPPRSFNIERPLEKLDEEVEERRDEVSEDKRDEEEEAERGDDCCWGRETVAQVTSDGATSLHTSWAFASRALLSSILLAYISMSLLWPIDLGVAVAACRRRSVDS